MINIYKSKYIKYKQKYLNYKKHKHTLIGGNNNTYVILFGMPGCGKSTLCNVLTGKNVCKSGFALVNELTTELQYYKVAEMPNYIFIDVPGGIFYNDTFNDVRKELIKVINNKFATFKFICITQFEGGRISPEVKRMIDNVVEHFKLHNSNILIIFNKLSEVAYRQLLDEKNKNEVLNVISSYPIFKNDNVLLIEKNVVLEDEDSENINFEQFSDIKNKIVENIKKIKGKSFDDHYPFIPFELDIKYSPILNNREKIYFSGPCSASIGILDNFTYIFFGDRHWSLDGTCQESYKKSDISHKHYNIVDYIKGIFKKNTMNNNFNDLYMELVYNRKEFDNKAFDNKSNDIDIDFADLIRNSFKQCLLKTENDTKTRCHYIDIRTKMLEDVLFFDIFTQIHNFDLEFMNTDFKNTFRLFVYYLFHGGYLKKFFEIQINSENVKDDLRKEVEFFLNDIGIKNNISDMKTFSAFLENNDIFASRENKCFHRAGLQLYELRKENNELADKIKKYLITMFNKEYTSNYNCGILKNLKLIIRNSRNKSYDLYNLLYQYYNYIHIISTNKYLFDAMLLGRLFRKFKNSNHTESTLKIVYAGNDHVKTYIDFFETVLNVNMFKYAASKEGNIRCVIAEADKFPKID
jgi:GTP-binding protein EngB required for normal cell division